MHPRLTVSVCVALLLGHGLAAQPPQRPTYPALPSETPATFEPVTASFDYVRRDVMIPMRDGVRLHTVVLTVTEPLIRSSQWMLGWCSTIQTICISD